MARSLVVALMIASAAETTFGQGARERPVWFWFATCGGPLMTLEVQFEGRIVHKSTFPLCRAGRGTVHQQGQDGRIEFTWRPEHAITWRGYRDTRNRTGTDEVLLGNIWEAGADPDALTLGVSFFSGKRIVMNTVHIAHPAARDESTIAKGLLVRTYPAAK